MASETGSMRDPLQRRDLDRAVQGGGDASTGGAPRKRRARVWRAAFAAVLLAALAACSSIRLGYNNADTLALYSLDSYFDLDDAQETLARERVRALIAWHRRTQLADYVQLIEETQSRLDRPVSAQDVLAVQSQMTERMQLLGRQAAPDLAKLARTLTPDQLAHFSNKMAKDNAKFRREQVSLRDAPGDAASEARIKRNLERARNWLGPLTREQEQLLREASTREPGADARWLAERERRQRVLLGVLERIRSEQLGAEQGGVLLRAYFEELQTPADPALRETVLRMRERNAQLIAQLLNSATPQQKALLAKKLRGYSNDFTVLASEGARG
jgi:hypothetical protein